MSAPREASPEERKLGGARFDVLRRIGAGGMGTVYEVFDRERQTRVALKTLLHFTQEGLLLFKREFRGIADIVHPNLVTLFELFAADEQWYFTMEFVDGTQLTRYLRPTAQSVWVPTQAPAGSFQQTRTIAPQEMISGTRTTSHAPGEGAFKGAVDEGRLRRVFTQIAEGLCAIHDSGMLHRDLKPENVLVTQEERAVILDFGLALASAEAATNAGLAGTVAYMAPEQAMQGPLRESADWYAFGTMLFEALSGKRPFQGTAREILAAKLMRPAPPVRSLVPDGPDDLLALCDALLKTPQEERPQAPEILARLSGTEVAGPGRQRRLSTFVGRERELAILEQAVDGASIGQPVVVMVSGPSGVGKSALSRQFLQRERQRGTLILQGRCFEQETVPFKAWDSVVDDLVRVLQRTPSLASDLHSAGSAALAQIFPALQTLPGFTGRTPPTGDPVERRRQAFTAFRELLRRLSAKRPVLIVIDDLHWGDLDSAALLADVLRPPSPPPVNLLCLFRAEQAACLQAVDAALSDNQAVQVIRLALSPLPEEDCIELAGRILGGKFDDDQLQTIAKESRGNAFFVLELCESGVRPMEGAAPTLDDMLAGRIAELPEEAQALLEVISLHGRPLAQVDVYAAAGLESRSLKPLTTLRARRLIRSRGFGDLDEVESYHDRVRETLVARLPENRKRSRHLSLATQLERAGRGEPEALAFHYESGGELTTAGGWYRTAATSASRVLAFEQSANHYQKALALLPLDAASASLLRGELAEALANAGRGADAGENFRLASADAPGEKRREFQRRAGYHFCASGHLVEGRQLLEQMLHADGFHLPKNDAAIRLGVLREIFLLALRPTRLANRRPGSVPQAQLDRIDTAVSAAVVFAMVDQFRSLFLANRVTRLAFAAGDADRVFNALMVSAPSAYVQGPIGRWVNRRLFAYLDAFLRDNPKPHYEARSLLAKGTSSYLQCRFAESIRHMEELLATLPSAVPGSSWELATARVFLSYAYSLCGEFHKLAAVTAEALSDSERRGDLYEDVMLGTWGVPFLSLVEDQPDRSMQETRAALERWPEVGFHVAHLTAYNVMAYADFYSGKREVSHSDVSRWWQEMRDNFFDRNDMLRPVWLAWMTRIALREALMPGQLRPKTYLAEAEGFSSRLNREKTPFGQAFAALARAAIADAKNDKQAAVRDFEFAARRFREQDWAPYSASCLRRAGELMGAEDGSRMVAEADSWFQSQGVRRSDRMTACFAGGYRPLFSGGKERL